MKNKKVLVCLVVALTILGICGYLINYHTERTVDFQPVKVFQVPNKNYDMTEMSSYYFITSEELLNHLTFLSYNYFKEEIKNKLTLEMSNIFLQWKEALSKINTKIKSNIGKFKYSIQEYGIISEMYNAIYSQNISYNYATSIIEQRKNDFNYTNRYYYNIKGS